MVVSFTTASISPPPVKTTLIAVPISFHYLGRIAKDFRLPFILSKKVGRSAKKSIFLMVHHCVLRRGEPLADVPYEGWSISASRPLPAWNSQRQRSERFQR
jgi:hypothetical protein